MSTFVVDRRKIASVKEHPNADRLDICQVEGLSYSFITGRGEYTIGDEAIYFPIDSVLPDSLVERLGIKHNRIRTMKLRGSISQGLVVRPDKVTEEELNAVTKYEAVEMIVRYQGGTPRPAEVTYYDLENWERYPNPLARLMDKEVWVTEKLEGTNYYCFVGIDGRVIVGGRNTSAPEGDNTFWNVTRKFGIAERAKELSQQYNADVVLRGELVGPGIQKNIYKLTAPCVYLFDLSLNGTFVPCREWYDELRELPIVPILARDVELGPWLAGQTLGERSNGYSALADTYREGIVVKPTEEEWDEEIGRLVLKARSPMYLANER